MSRLLRCSPSPLPPVLLLAPLAPARIPASSRASSLRCASRRHARVHAYLRCRGSRYSAFIYLFAADVSRWYRDAHRSRVFVGPARTRAVYIPITRSLSRSVNFQPLDHVLERANKPCYDNVAPSRPIFFHLCRRLATVYSRSRLQVAPAGCACSILVHCWSRAALVARAREQH